jgi:hypothetical protein
MSAETARVKSRDVVYEVTLRFLGEDVWLLKPR